MGLTMTLVVGALAGLLAGLVIRGRSLGFGWNLLIGVAGAFLGSRIFYLLGITVHLTLWTGLLMAFVGAVVLLAVISALRNAWHRSSS